MSGWQWNGLVQTRAVGGSTRKAVLMFLADAADENGRSFYSIGTMAASLEYNERTVRRALDEFDEEGLIVRDRERRADGTLGVYAYRLQWDPLARLPWNGVRRRGLDSDPFAPPGAESTGTGQPPDSDDTTTGHSVRAEPDREEPQPQTPLSSAPSAPAEDAASTEVQQLCTALADAVERYRDGAQGGRPKITGKWLKDMRLLLERGPLGADKAVAIEPERVAACIAVVFRELAEPSGSGFCWAKNVQSPSALRRHWWQIYTAAREQRQRSQLGKLGPVVRAGSGDVTPLGEVLAQHAEAMGRRQLAAPARPALGAVGS